MGALDFCARCRAINALQVAVGAEIAVAPQLHRTCPVNYSGAAVAVSRSWRVPEAPFLGAPDSPVNYSGAPLEIPEGGKFELESSGAPDTVRCTPDSPVLQTRGAFGCPLLSLLNPIFGLFIG
jgi:hypothetical protein